MGDPEVVVTSDKDALDSEFEREPPDARPAALEAACYAQRRRPAAGRSAQIRRSSNSPRWFKEPCHA